MEIRRSNFSFNREINPTDIINDSVLFCMEQEDIDADDIVNCEVLKDGDNILVFQNIHEPNKGERYCYLRTNTCVGGDGHTKLIRIDKIIIDGCLLNRDLFVRIFNILLQRENNGYRNRLVLTNHFNECFCGRIDETATAAADLVYNLYKTYTSDLSTNYVIQ